MSDASSNSYLNKGIKFIINEPNPTPMKVMNRYDERAMKEYLSKPPEKTHSREELEALHRAIRFTHENSNLAEEALEKMNEEELIQRVPFFLPPAR